VSEQERRDEELAEGADPFFPATDPVLSPSGRMMGGFAKTSMDSLGVAPSTLDHRPGDEALADAIRRELREDACTASLQIHVEVRGSVAFLHGRVDGLEDADNAAEVASRVRGVRQVVEHLTVPEP
jgi:osmotically-inducible protein OsmY